MIEEGFGRALGISDEEYEKAGCVIMHRKAIFEQSDIIFSLKLIQSSDYKYLKNGQIILGWTHPFGSGSLFYKTICKEKDIVLIDIDSTKPRIISNDEIFDIEEIPIG